MLDAKTRCVKHDGVLYTAEGAVTNQRATQPQHIHEKHFAFVVHFSSMIIRSRGGGPADCVADETLSGDLRNIIRWNGGQADYSVAIMQGLFQVYPYCLFCLFSPASFPLKISLVFSYHLFSCSDPYS